MKRISFALAVAGVAGLCQFNLAVHSQVVTQSTIYPPAARVYPTPPTPAAPLQPTPIPVVQVPPPGATIPAPPPAAAGPLAPGMLAWDADLKETTVKAGDAEAKFLFNLTNVSSGDITINQVQTSCGCTAAHLPTMPWKINSGTSGEIPITMNLAGKSGVVFKTITIHTDKGQKMLTVKTVITPAPPAPMTEADRLRNQELVKADRQAVFKGDCARCHVEPAIGKFGKDLFTAACGVCHEAEHRASMVPDLHKLPHETNAEFWKTWIAYGKDGSLMPAFAQTQGGPLSNEQIKSLVDYLTTAIPSVPGTPAPLPTHAAK